MKKAIIILAMALCALSVKAALTLNVFLTGGAYYPIPLVENLHLRYIFDETFYFELFFEGASPDEISKLQAFGVTGFSVDDPEDWYISVENSGNTKEYNLDEYGIFWAKEQRELRIYEKETEIYDAYEPETTIIFKKGEDSSFIASVSTSKDVIRFYGETLEINLNSIETVKVYNIDGKLEKVFNTPTANLSDLPAGMYIIVVNDTISSKICK